MKVDRFGCDLLVDRRRRCVQESHFKGHLRHGSNSLRPGPLRNEIEPPERPRLQGGSSSASASRAVGARSVADATAVRSDRPVTALPVTPMTAESAVR